MIKVRIWDKQYNIWANTSHFCFDKNGEITWDSSRMSPQPKSMDEFIVQQLCGKEEKGDIFEGDIVKQTHTLIPNLCQIGTIKLLSSGFYWCDLENKVFNPMGAGGSKLEVIGNILENKELLNK